MKKYTAPTICTLAAISQSVMLNGSLPIDPTRETDEALSKGNAFEEEWNTGDNGTETIFNGIY